MDEPSNPPGEFLNSYSSQDKLICAQRPVGDCGCTEAPSMAPPHSKGENNLTINEGPISMVFTNSDNFAAQSRYINDLRCGLATEIKPEYQDQFVME